MSEVIKETVDGWTTTIDENGVTCSQDINVLEKYAKVVSDEIAEQAKERPVATTVVAGVAAAAVGYCSYKIVAKLLS